MYIKVEALPGAKRETVEETDEFRLKVAVREKAERGMANARIRTLVARHYGVPEKAVRLVNGHQHPRKLFSVDDSYSR